MIKMAFYKGMGVGGDWKKKAVHLGISRISSPHTHVELVFSDGLSFSSEFGKGPRLKNIGYSHPERWTIVELPHISPDTEARIRHRAKVLSRLCDGGHLAYDTRGAIGCTLTGRESVWKYFCSEAVYEVLSPDIAIPALNHKMHPQKLFEIIEVIKDLQAI